MRARASQHRQDPGNCFSASVIRSLARSEQTPCNCVLTPRNWNVARHIVLREVGGPGQAALKRARVLVIGAGGLGAPLLMYLAAAGVGTLGVIDDDAVALSNLQRQVIHGTPDFGAPKVGARRRDRAAQSECDGRDAQRAARPPRTRWTHLALRLVADGSDNFATRYLVSDACYLAEKPLVPRRSAPSTARSPRSGRTNAAGRKAKSDLPLPVSRTAAAGTVPACRRPESSARSPAWSAP